MSCPCCQRPRPPNPVIDGIWFAPYTSAPTHIAYRCVCKTNRSIPWADASPAQRWQAYLAELARDGENEMMVEEG